MVASITEKPALERVGEPGSGVDEGLEGPEGLAEGLVPACRERWWQRICSVRSIGVPREAGDPQGLQVTNDRSRIAGHG
jgi:hypothetical protein